MDFEDIWHVVGVVLVLTAATLLSVMIVAPKKVDGYYFSKPQGNDGVACVYAHWTWHTDEKSFCTNNYQEALEFVAKANASIR